MKKAANVLGIAAAWLLSLVLILMLTVTPIVFSALSLLNSDTITQVVAGALTSAADGEEDRPAAENPKVTTLSATTDTVTAEDAGKELLADIFGDSINQEQVAAIFSTNAVKELIEAYTDDLSNAITGGDKEASFNAEKIKNIVNDNIDEIVEVLQANVPELADTDAAELKSKIQKAVDENAEEIVQALPKPEDIKQQLIQSNPALETAAKLLAMKDKIELAVAGVMVVLSGLIFVCRLPGFKGFRWLATDLFVGGGANAFIIVGLLISKSAVSEIAAQANPQIAGFVGSLLDAFTNGMLVRTVVMLAVGTVFLGVYIFIKRQKKTLAENAAQ